MSIPKNAKRKSPTEIPDIGEPVDPDAIPISENAKALEREIRTYCRELPRLIQEGETGRFALIKGDEVISIWDTQRDGIQAGRERYGLEPIAVVPIDPIYMERFRLIVEQHRSKQCPS